MGEFVEDDGDREAEDPVTERDDRIDPGEAQQQFGRRRGSRRPRRWRAYRARDQRTIAPAAIKSGTRSTMRGSGRTFGYISTYRAVTSRFQMSAGKSSYTAKAEASGLSPRGFASALIRSARRIQ